MSPFVNSLIVSRTTLVSNSECRSSAVSGAGAVEAKMLSIAPSGASLPSCMISSSTRCSSFNDIGMGTSGVSSATGVDACVRVAARLQKERRPASVLNTGPAFSELGFDASDATESADGGRSIAFPMSWFELAALPPCRKRIAGAGRNCTRGDDRTGRGGRSSSDSTPSRLRSVGCVVICGMRDGRECARLREASVFSATRARSSTNGICVTPDTPYTVCRGSSTGQRRHRVRRAELREWTHRFRPPFAH